MLRGSLAESVHAVRKSPKTNYVKVSETGDETVCGSLRVVLYVTVGRDCLRKCEFRNGRRAHFGFEREERRRDRSARRRLTKTSRFPLWTLFLLSLFLGPARAHHSGIRPPFLTENLWGPSPRKVSLFGRERRSSAQIFPEKWQSER